MRCATLASAAATTLFAVSEAASVAEWKSRSIYQVMIDRFSLTDGSTDNKCTDYSQFCNGTWTGLLNKLDYIQDMGFTAIQISPIVQNIENDTIVGDAYHGYWSQDLYAINEHYGTADDLKALIEEMHNRDMYVLVDVVVNNMAQAFNNTYPPPIDYSKFDPFNNKDDFHTYCNVTEWTNSTNYQECWLYPLGVALADLKTESDTVVDMFGTWIKELVANYSIDGMRIDAAKHVDDAFLPTFISESGIFAMGEVLTGVVENMCRYQTKGLLPSMPNYLEYYPLLTSFDGGSMADLAEMRAEAAESCNDTMALGSFVENHDMPRFASLNADMTIAKNAMAYVILNDGIPLVYQGQEQHFSGGATPANREPLWLSGYNTTSELYVVAKKLNTLRNAVIGLTNTSDTTYVDSAAETLFTNVNHLCMAKGPAGAQIVSCVVNQGSTGSSYQLSIGGFEAGDEVTEVLGCTTSTADGTGNVTMYMSSGEPKAYALSSVVNSTDLCSTTQDAASAAADNAGSGLQVGATAGLVVALGWMMVMLA